MEPPKKNFQLRYKESFIAAQIASMAVTGEQARPQFQSIEPDDLQVRSPGPQVHKFGPGILDIHITSPNQAQLLDHTQTQDFQIEQTQRMFETEMTGKCTDDEVVVEQSVSHITPAISTVEAKESSTVQNSLTDLISKKTLDLNNNGLSARKKLKKSGLDITIGVTSTQPVKQVSRLNIEIDPD